MKPSKKRFSDLLFDLLLRKSAAMMVWLLLAQSKAPTSFPHAWGCLFEHVPDPKWQARSISSMTKEVDESTLPMCCIIPIRPEM